jgi:indolepyruvate ferredoxin oxidoreductase beta subunit
VSTCSLVVVGVGGQGVITTARLLGRGAMEAGLDVRVGQIYGLSQRGGSVEATVRIGSVSTAFVSRSTSDIVLGLEPLETERAIPAMSSSTAVVVNATPIVPASLTQSRADYPEVGSIVARIAEVAGTVHVVEGSALARELGNPRLVNLVMLGALDGLGLLPFPTEAMIAAVRGEGSSGDRETLVEAFRLGSRAAAESSARPAHLHG